MYLSNWVQQEEVEIRFLIEDTQKGALDTTQKGQDTTQKNQDTTQKTTQKGQDTTQKILEEIKKESFNLTRWTCRKVWTHKWWNKYNIRKLREKGIIKCIGPDKGGHWEIIE